MLFSLIQIGGTFGIPVLMPNEVVIGALARVRQVPRFVDDSSDELYRAHILQVVWSADHRIVDGATMTRFSNTWKGLLEDPFKLLLLQS